MEPRLQPDPRWSLRQGRWRRRAVARPTQNPDSGQPPRERAQDSDTSWVCQNCSANKTLCRICGKPRPKRPPATFDQSPTKSMDDVLSPPPHVGKMYLSSEGKVVDEGGTAFPAEHQKKHLFKLRDRLYSLTKGSIRAGDSTGSTREAKASQLRTAAPLAVRTKNGSHLHVHRTEEEDRCGRGKIGHQNPSIGGTGQDGDRAEQGRAPGGPTPADGAGGHDPGVSQRSRKAPLSSEQVGDLV